MSDLGFNFNNLKGLPIYFIHGDQDKNIPVQDARLTAAKCERMDLNYKYVEVKGAGHIDIPAKEVHKILDWFKQEVFDKMGQ